jgi:hypothetical protein
MAQQTVEDEASMHERTAEVAVDPEESESSAEKPDVGAIVDDLVERFGEKRLSSERSVDLGRYESFASELVRFLPPDDLPPEHGELVSKIVVLDHRSLHAFGPHSQARAEVKALLQNAVISAGYSLGDFVPEKVKPIAAPAALYKQAEEIFTRHMETRNRTYYVVGVAGGILLLTIAGSLAAYLPRAVQEAIDPDLVPALIWFAGLGSIVSVLMRLSTLDVVREISARILVISGTGRPFVASAFALVVYLVMTSKLVSLSLGSQANAGAYFVVAFLCGFSERFAKDILDRTETGLVQAGKG